MAKITFHVVQKPIEQRLIDAACIYYDVERIYFNKTNTREKSKVVQRRNILYFLIKHNCPALSWKDVANLFGYSAHEPVIEGVGNIEAQKNVWQQISNDINQIQAIADKLDADFIEREIVLVNNKLTINKQP